MIRIASGSAARITRAFERRFVPKTNKPVPVAEAAYPREEERDVVLRTGSTLRLRPIRPEDAPALLAFYTPALPGQSLFPLLLASRRSTPEKAGGLSAGVDYDGRSSCSSREAGGRHRRGGRLLPRPDASRPRGGRLHRRGRAAGPGDRDAPARASGRDRARPGDHDLRGRRPRPEPPHARRLPRLRLRASRSTVERGSSKDRHLARHRRPRFAGAAPPSAPSARPPRR